MKDMNQLYAERLDRYIAAMRGGRPDRVPIRPFAAEFTARYAGYTCQQVTHDYRQAFEAVIRCCRDFDWDAAVPNMVYVWTGLTQAAGLKYYGVPGIEVPADVGFQYREPSQENAFMRREEYDELIEDPVRFLYQTWLPRVSGDIRARDCPTSYRNNLALVKSSMAMLAYFTAFGPQVERMRSECGTVSAICGMLKAPLDILADKLRGYVALAFDLMEIPDKVLAACQALAPHLAHVALSGLDPEHKIPIPIWMHRGCVPFISHELFDRIYWATLKPIVEAIWGRGNQVLMYAEGNWDAHLDRFAELPDHSIVWHVDRGDIAAARRAFGGRFCLSGGIPNDVLAYGTPEEVRACCRKAIDAADGGGYILDAGAILQNDASPENIRAMTEFTREYGVYGGPTSVPEIPPAGPPAPPPATGRVPPGVCIPWEEKLRELGPIAGDAALVRRVWEDVEALAYTYIWHMLLSF